MKKTMVTFGICAFLAVGMAANETHWDYNEHGSAHWGEFAGECKNGHAQSPINIISKTHKAPKG
jgi:carbonic anhydrase